MGFSITLGPRQGSPSLLRELVSNFFDLSESNRRWAVPKPKDLEGDWRKAYADRLRLSRLAKHWCTGAQLGLLSAAPRDPEEAFRFAVLGDAEPGRFWIFRKLFNVPGVFERQLRAIQSCGADFSIQLGDMVSRGTAKNYLAFLRDLEGWPITVPYLTVIGNHDRSFPHGQSDDVLYRTCFGKTNYVFDRGPARFVVVDSSAQRLTGFQLEWLDWVLDVPKIKIVFTHIPPAELRWTDYAGARVLGGFRHGAQEFTRLMSRRRVERVYCGHIHAFGVQDYQGVRYVLSGGGGSPLFPSGVPDRFHHYLIVTVSSRGVSETVHAAQGPMAIPGARVVLSR